MQVISLFSGIGGFEIAARWMGWDNVVSCEINDFGRKVLKYHFPNSYHHDDVKTLTYETIKEKSRYEENKPTILVGGFPCQPFSVAGQQKGTDDERHLWPEMRRIIQEVKPTYIVAENVRGILNIEGGMVFEQVQTDLENEGYEVQTFIIPACGKNAPHKRDRVWFVAYSCNSYEVGRPKKDASSCRRERVQQSNKIQFTTQSSGLWGNVTDTHSDGGQDKCRRIRKETAKKKREHERLEAIGINGENELIADTNNKRLARQCFSESDDKERWQNKRRCVVKSSSDIRRTLQTERWQNFPTQSPICGRNDGISERLAGITFPKWRKEALKAYGNAIVPQIAFEIFKAIERTK